MAVMHFRRLGLVKISLWLLFLLNSRNYVAADAGVNISPKGEQTQESNDNLSATLVDYFISKQSLSSSVQAVVNSSDYSKDNLLTFCVSLQPNMLVWSSALTFGKYKSDLTRKVIFDNVKEEMFGSDDKNEGSHYLLSSDFFSQLGPFQSQHYDRTRDEIRDIYNHISNYRVILTVLACVETWSSLAMPAVGDQMKTLGAHNFIYIDIHRAADNAATGHSRAFLDAIEAEEVQESEIQLGVKLFVSLFKKIFVPLNHANIQE